MSSERRAIRSAAPTFEPVSLAEAKKHLEIAEDDAAHDAHIMRLIQHARELVEHDTGIVLASGTYTFTLDDFPDDDEIYLPVRPVSSITSIVYTDTAGTSQTMSSANYALDNNEHSPEIVLAYLALWPTARGEPNSVVITFVAGYSSQATIPQSLKQACLLEISRRFQDREGWERSTDMMAYERITNRHARASYP